MAKFYGSIGFGESVETSPGVWEDVIVEKPYYGDVIRDTLEVETSDKILNDIRTGNSFSIVADPYAQNNFFAMRYIQWAGTLWYIKQVEVRSPRLIIRIGGVYNGPTAGVEPDPDDDSGVG